MNAAVGGLRPTSTLTNKYVLRVGNLIMCSLVVKNNRKNKWFDKNGVVFI
jgi:predicted deacetylase